MRLKNLTRKKQRGGGGFTHDKSAYKCFQDFVKIKKILSGNKKNTIKLNNFTSYKNNKNNNKKTNKKIISTDGVEGPEINGLQINKVYHHECHGKEYNFIIKSVGEQHSHHYELFNEDTLIHTYPYF